MLIGELPGRCARRNPKKDATVFQGERSSFRGFNERVNRAANALVSMGVRKGEKVAVLSRNRPEMLEVMFACAKLGVIYVPIDFRLGAAEVRFVLGDVEAKVLFLEIGFADSLDNAGRKAVERVFVLEVDYEGLLADASDAEPEAEVSPDDVFAIFYTSGTTGTPKGVMLTHENFGSAAINHVIAYRLGPDDVCLHVMSFYHTMEASMAVCQFYVGGTNVIVQGFGAGEFWNLVRDEGVTHITLVYTMLTEILDEYEASGRELNRPRTISAGGQAVPVEVIRRTLRLLGPGKLFVVFGITEASPLLTYLSKEDIGTGESHPERLSAIGKELFECHVRVVDEEDNDVAPGELGELIARGPNIMKGYYNRPEATAEALRGGWLRTGDVATMDEDGYLYIVDRKKDIIISGGENVAPREVEEVLYSHPAVAECSVIGVPDEKWGERVHAVVVAKRGAAADAEALISHCRQALANYKCPRSVEFADALPRDPVGKIQKKVLREEYARAHAAEASR
jgi:acyl-CoA synthetase (AMP-forming)/AMP-acid ligase II